MPFAEPEDPVPASVVTAEPSEEVVVELLDVLLFLAQEIMVRLKRDIRITCKIFFILSSKSQEFIANLKSHIFIFWKQRL